MKIIKNDDIQNRLGNILDNCRNYEDFCETLRDTTIKINEKGDVEDYFSEDVYEQYIEDRLDELILSGKSLAKNPYIADIKFEKKTFKNLEIKALPFKRGEVFHLGTSYNSRDKSEILPIIACFDKDVRFPILLRKNKLVAGIDPSIMYSMEQKCEKMKGDVLLLGLELGYFLYRCEYNPSVTSITVVESDKRLIQLFERVIKPQMSLSKEVNIVKDIEYNTFISDLSKYDTIFVNQWTSASIEEFDKYMKYKSWQILYAKNKNIEYWLEEAFTYTICSWFFAYLRTVYFDNINIERTMFSNKYYEHFKIFNKIVDEMGFREVNTTDEFDSLIARVEEIVESFIKEYVKKYNI
jgi:hypothetical protein